MFMGKKKSTVSISGIAGDRVTVAKRRRHFGTVQMMGPKTHIAMDADHKVSDTTAQKALRQGIVYNYRRSPYAQVVVPVKSVQDAVILTESTAQKAKRVQKAQIAQYLHQEQVDVDNALATLKRLQKNNNKVYVGVK